MPRNIDDLLERYIEKENLPQFILTCSIYNGFFPSAILLKKFGNEYGTDTFISSHEQVCEQIISLTHKLDKLLIPTEGDNDNLFNEIDKLYNNKYREYIYWFTYLQKLIKMDGRIRKLVANNEKERKFLLFITNYISEQKSIIRNQHLKSLKPPIRETFEHAKERLIKELRESIEKLKCRLLFNDSFFENISKKWLR